MHQDTPSSFASLARPRPGLRRAALGLVLGLTAAAPGCGSLLGVEEAKLTKPDEDKDGNVVGTPREGETALVRFALFHGAAPEVNVCVRPSGQGGEYAPVLPGVGLRYPSVSAYAPLVANTYDVAYVRRGEDCNVAATRPTENAVFSGLEATAGARLTLTLTGDTALTGERGVARWLPLRDAAPPAEREGVRVRFVHSYLGITDYSLGFDEGLYRGDGPSDAYVDVFAGANFEAGIAPPGPLVDELGYSTVPLPRLDQNFVFWQKWYDGDRNATDPEDSGVSWQLPAGAVVDAGSAVTLFYVGRETGFAEDEVDLLLCRDGREVAGLTDCTPLELAAATRRARAGRRRALSADRRRRTALRGGRRRRRRRRRCARG